MPKVRNVYYQVDNKFFEVYGARTRKKNYRDYEHEWIEEEIEILIYDGRWLWVNAEGYEPVES